MEWIFPGSALVRSEKAEHNQDEHAQNIRRSSQTIPFFHQEVGCPAQGKAQADGREIGKPVSHQYGSEPDQPWNRQKANQIEKQAKKPPQLLLSNIKPYLL